MTKAIPHSFFNNEGGLRKMALIQLAGLLMLLTGCISYPRQPLNRAEGSSIKKIALVTVSEPQVSVVIEGGSGSRVGARVGMGFGAVGAVVGGAVGGLVDAAIQDSRTGELRRKWSAQKAAVGQNLTSAIEAELVNQGYEVTLVAKQPNLIDASSFEYDYSQIVSGADAILHTWFHRTSYVAISGSPYRPDVVVCARLLLAKDRSQMYFQTFRYAASSSIENVEHVTVPVEYDFHDFDLLLAQSSEAEVGIQQGGLRIAARIAEQLGGRPPLQRPRPTPRTSSFPKKAFGFAIGRPSADVKSACEAAGHTWSMSNGAAMCSGTAGVDMAASAQLTFSIDALTGVLLSLEVSEDMNEWVAQFGSLEKTFRAKYGDPDASEDHEPTDCKGQLDRCWKEGRAHRSRVWAWGPSRIQLRLGRLQNDSTLPLLFVEYSLPIEYYVPVKEAAPQGMSLLPSAQHTRVDLITFQRKLVTLILEGDQRIEGKLVEVNDIIAVIEKDDGKRVTVQRATIAAARLANPEAAR